MTCILVESERTNNNLGIGFGVDDFLGSEDNYGELLLPLLVALSSRGVSLRDDPENLPNDGTSHGLVPLAVPSSPHALVRSRAGPRHLQEKTDFFCVL